MERFAARIHHWRGATCGLSKRCLGSSLAARKFAFGLVGVLRRCRMTFALVALGLMVVVVAACLIPATQAMRVDPITTMRAE